MSTDGPRIAPPRRPPAQTRLAFVVPCYNEELVLPQTLARLGALADRLVAEGRIAPQSELVFVDDGSRDRTWPLIREANERDPRVRGLKLSRNRGHQNALLAGLLLAGGDVIVSLDADLQDDLEAIPRMLDAYYGGAEIVFGVRNRRDVDTPFKRLSARAYYRLLILFGVDAVPDHADFRLMSRVALEALREFGEVHLFLRGIVPMLGFTTARVPYDRLERVAGETRYPLLKMVALALDGIMAFSSLPLQLIFPAGVGMSVVAGGLGVWAIVVKLTNDAAVPGWASTVVPTYFLGGLQLLASGVIAGYLARIYNETKRRPRYIIEERL
jgi:glycosyltransferase involved in cell wall biosynthesis